MNQKTNKQAPITLLNFPFKNFGSHLYQESNSQKIRSSILVKTTNHKI